MKRSLSQITNTTKHKKAFCSYIVVVQYINGQTLQTYKGYFINFYQIKTLEIM